MPTIYDIARSANVSKSTVSRVINNQTNISPKARSKVLKAMEDLNYYPNKVARSLNTGFDAIMVISRSTKTTADNPFFSEILYSISQKAEEENFDVILQTSKNEQDELRKCLNKIREKMIKGIIMITSPANEELFKQIDIFNIPVVVIGKVEGNYNNIFSVDTDNYQDSFDLTRYLIEMGHNKIGCLHSPLNYHVSIDRLKGFIDCLNEYDIKTRNDWIIDSGNTSSEAYLAAEKLLLSEAPPSAIFGSDDLKVMALYQVASENGIHIPDKVSIVGYINSRISSILFPPLTSVEIPIQTLGETGTELLFSKIKNQPLKQDALTIATNKVIKKSVARI